MRRLLLLVVVCFVVLSGSAAAQPFPERIALPDGWQPEGIAYGTGFLYSGSLVDGAIYRADVRSGAGMVIVPGMTGRVAVGLDLSRDSSLLFVAGGGTGDAYVYDTETGATVATYNFTDDPNTFVNDVIVTSDAAWFTDSFQQVLYRVELTRGGTPGSASTVPLTGDITYTDGFNVNGIEATAGGDTLIVVQGNTGQLFTVDADSGVADEIDLGDGDVANGDGILLRGRTLYVVQNFLNQIAVVQLSGDLSSGSVVETVSDPGFDIPTTIARRGSSLYAVNARFSTPPMADTEYWITQVPLP